MLYEKLTWYGQNLGNEPENNKIDAHDDNQVYYNI